MSYIDIFGYFYVYAIPQANQLLWIYVHWRGKNSINIHSYPTEDVLRMKWASDFDLGKFKALNVRLT